MNGAGMMGRSTSAIGLVAVLCFIGLIWRLSSGAPPAASPHYAVMVDAGSSGSRIFVYKWHEAADPAQPIVVQQHVADGVPVTRKFEPGLSSYTDAPWDAFQSLKPGLAYAASHIPVAEHSATPVYVFGTAGLRAIEESARMAIIKAVRTGIDRDFAFKVADGHVAAISGEQEAIYAWVTANYILGSLDGSTKTRGIVDLGGGSMQIAFEAPRSGKWQNSVETVRVGSTTSYDVFRVTHLGFGVQSAHETYTALHASDFPGAPDPCLPSGFAETHNGAEVAGKGNFEQCRTEVQKVLSAATVCQNGHSKCVFNEKAHPPIESDREFMGFSEYWYGTNDVMGLGGSLNINKLSEESTKYCSQSKDEIIAHGHTVGYPGFAKEQTEDKGFWLRRQCFKSAYIPATLEAWGFPSSPKNFASHLKVKGEELQWTLGAVVLLLQQEPVAESSWFWFWLKFLVGILLCVGAYKAYTTRSGQLLTQRYTLPTFHR